MLQQRQLIIGTSRGELGVARFLAMRAMRFLNEHPQSDFARVDIFSADSNPNRLWRAWALQPVLLAMLSPFQQCLHTCLNAERTPAALRWAIRFTSTCSKCANASLYKKAARVHQSHAGSASNRTRTKTHVHMHTRTHARTHTHTHTRTCTRPAPPAGPNETGGKAHPPKTKAPVPQGSIYPTGTRFHIPDLIARYEERGSYRKPGS